MTADLTAAAIRALAGEPDVRLRAGTPYLGGRPVPMPAPHLHPAADGDTACHRGAADGMALRLRHSDTELHRSLRPSDPLRRLVFEQLEQFRVETFAALPGVAANLRHRFRAWSLAVHRDGLTESARGLLLFGVAQVCRARITGEPVVEEIEGVIESTHFALAPLLGHDLAGLRRHRADQQAFARHALAVADAVASLAGDSGDADDVDQTDAVDRETLTLLARFDDPGEDGAIAAVGDAELPDGPSVGYRAFTTAYDRCDDAATLVRPAQLREFRERLDQLVARQGVNVARLAGDLVALLAEPARDGWDGGLEEGYVDGRMLARLVTSPSERRLFRAERFAPVADVLVTVLVDCSGSMRAHAEPVAVLVDVLARALERAGADSEILGFTTAAWHGGRARRDWVRAGRPSAPGRLAELRHLVFKSADTPWQRARPALGALLRADLFREGVDGEAVRWAATRALAHPARRRLLLVVSDGGPSEGATALANDQHYLDRDLVTAVAAADASGVEVRALGVGLDLGVYYPHARTLDTSATGYRMVADVLDLLARKGN